jgi:hypothetical protein
VLKRYRCTNEEDLVTNNQLSKAGQQTAVGEGLAIGCLALGVKAVTSQKMAVELAFGHAWSKWSWNSSFPAINATLPRNDILTILRSSTRRRGSFLAHWLCGKELEPVLRDDAEPDELAEALGESSGVPLVGWITLARTFVERFDPAQVRRSS